ncbi:ATP-binding protein [Streptomyces sp. H27-D2]|uniref:ATP-binding protein n=1 Tax=Streptomyces sp. H27-D2 TaxID=3046304 RepID=UPI002DB7603E|nr:ATP-binding protein [Streptomyces sp. H27-D2]MEC4017747.1 ATP-binding protein [Streptomyces sp. H27-D2]
MAEAAASPPQEPPTPGFYLRPRSRGFVAHVIASARNFRSLREVIAKGLSDLGVDSDTVDTVRLVVSELTGNGVRACGEYVPLVVEVYVGVEADAEARAGGEAGAVYINVHDPEPRRPLRRSGIALDDPDAESGRGLALLDLLCPGWRVANSPIGKQIRCRLACPAG